MEHAKLNGYTIYYANYKDVEYGYLYLSSLTANQFDTLVDGAKADGTASFPDKYGTAFIINYNHSDGTFTLARE